MPSAFLRAPISVLLCTFVLASMPICNGCTIRSAAGESDGSIEVEDEAAPPSGSLTIDELRDLDIASADGGLSGQLKSFNCSASQLQTIAADKRAAVVALMAMRRRVLDGSNWFVREFVNPSFVIPPYIIEDALNRIDAMLAGFQHGFDSSCERIAQCSNGAAAWVGLQWQINFCDSYFELPEFYRIALVVHEASHRALGTRDEFYDCEGGMGDLSDEYNRRTRLPSVRSQVNSFFFGHEPYSCRPDLGAACEDGCNWYGIPDTNAEWWMSSIVALAEELNDTYYAHNGSEITPGQMNQEFDAITTYGHDPKPVFDCAAVHLHATWAQAARPSPEWFAQVDALRDYVLAQGGSPSSCYHINHLFDVVNDAELPMIVALPGMPEEEETPEGTIPYHYRTATAGDYARFAASSTTPVDDEDVVKYFRGVSTARMMAALF